MKLPYVVQGDGDGPKVVFAHGLMGTGTVQRAQLAPLVEAGWTVVTFDQRGHGSAPPITDPSGYDPHDMGADLWEVVDAAGFDRCWIGGGSMGAATSFCAATAQPDRVLGLIQAVPAFDAQPHAAVFLFEALADQVRDEGIDGLVAILRKFTGEAGRAPSDDLFLEQLRTHDQASIECALRSVPRWVLPDYPSAFTDVDVPGHRHRLAGRPRPSVRDRARRRVRRASRRSRIGPERCDERSGAVRPSIVGGTAGGAHMNFDLGPDEIALRDGIRELCTRRFPMERVREGFTADGWKALGEAGVFSLRLPETDGGVGLGMTEAVIVFEELGRALVPGPLVATHLAAGLIDGAEVVGLLEGDLLEHPASVDACIAISDQVGVGEPGDHRLLEPLDPLTPIGRLDDAGVVPATADAGRLSLEGATLTAALSSGIASKTVELAVAFAKERHQFDKPIGAFQAVKHMCADMLVRAEVARSAVDAAGVLLDDPAEDATRAVRTAKLLASEYAIANAKTCIQVHGGMGFTWEVDAHLYLKRAAVLATQFGGVDEQAELIAASL